MSQETLSRAWEVLQDAYQAQMEGDYDRAVELYRSSLDLHPTAEAHTFLGWTYHFQGRLDDAISECKRAIEIDPEFGNPYNDIGAYLIELNRFDEAIPWLERAVEARTLRAAPLSPLQPWPRLPRQGNVRSRHRMLPASPGDRAALFARPRHAGFSAPHGELTEQTLAEAQSQFGVHSLPLSNASRLKCQLNLASADKNTLRKSSRPFSVSPVASRKIPKTYLAQVLPLSAPTCISAIPPFNRPHPRRIIESIEMLCRSSRPNQIRNSASP